MYFESILKKWIDDTYDVKSKKLGRIFYITDKNIVKDRAARKLTAELLKNYYIFNEFFYKPPNCEYIVMSDNILVIESYAFSEFINLKNIRLSRKLTIIHHNAFDGCKKK